MPKYYRTPCFAIILLFCSAGSIYSQHTLPCPPDIQKAYGKGTRTYHGAPGKNYWQNKAEYQIRAYLDPDAKTISGHQKAVYWNNSPDTLSNLVIRLYQDVYKKGNARDFAVSTDDVHDGVKLIFIKAGDQLIDSKTVARNGTNMILPLEPLLYPGESTEIEISWQYPISKITTLREGYYKNHDAFFIAYWYPQISVYDDVWGWNMFSYTGMQEFYNDFNNYEVEISVPAGYVVWATGTLENAKDNLAPHIYKKYLEANQSDNIINVIDTSDYATGSATTQKDTLKWIYTARNVTDFAFAVSNHYLWQASTLRLSGHDVMISAAFDRNSMDFYEVAQVARESIEFYSREMPGVEYPYPAMTVVNGRGGMEFPMMVNDGSMSNRSSMVFVTTHEIAHTYFPFYMGINEQMFAFMDEGWAMMLPFELQSRLAGDQNPVARTVNMFEYSARSSLESQLMLPTVALSGQVYSQAYRNSAYSKPGLAYHYLREVLGDKIFMKVLHEFMARWNGRHPLPYDFFYTFNEVAGEDLSWFWKPWFFETGHPDLCILSVVSEKNRHKIMVRNQGNIPVPVELKLTYADGSTEIVRESARIWKDGNASYEIIVKGNKGINNVSVGNDDIADLNRENNFWRKR